MPDNMLTRCTACNYKFGTPTSQYVSDKLEPGTHRVGFDSVDIPDGSEATRLQAQVVCPWCGVCYTHIIIGNGESIMTDTLVKNDNSNPEVGERNELLEKVRRLNESIQEVEASKKNAAANYNDELHELKDELKDTLNLLKDTPTFS